MYSNFNYSWHVFPSQRFVRATHKNVTLYNSTRLGSTSFKKTLKNAHQITTECSKLWDLNYFKCVINCVIKLFFRTRILFVKEHTFFLKITCYF